MLALSRTSMLGGLRWVESGIYGRQRLCSSLLASHALQPRRLAHRQSVAVQARWGGEALSRALSSDLEGSESLYLEPFLRTLILGMATGALLEAGHFVLQVLTGSFPGVSEFSPMIATDHVVGLASWACLYAIEAWCIAAALKRCNFDRQAAAKELRAISTLPKRMLPIRMSLLKRLVLAGARLRQRQQGLAATAALPAAVDVDVTEVHAPAALAASASEAAAAPKAAPKPAAHALPKLTQNAIAPAPGLLRRPGTGGSAPGGPENDPARPKQEEGFAGVQLGSGVARRQKELQDRQSYLANFWYAAALSEKVRDEPVKVQLCGKELVLFRGEDGRVRCVDNICPHRGAPLSDGWVGQKDGHDCIVCPYHGWAFDEAGALRDVPAAANKGEWPKRPLLDAYDVEEKGGFVWLFYGSRGLPAEARPPIPHVPELDNPEWKAVYEELEFECNHFGVFENAFDFAHIHYLHADSFGARDKPEVRDIAYAADEWGVTASFTIHNKPVNAFWALFQVPAVHVTARAFLPSTSMVTFTLGNGLSFTTFVNTVPLSATRSINRFALIRNLAFDRTGLFNAGIWDGIARNAMLKILGEDKAMVEQLNYDQLPAEYSVRADGPQVAFRKLRQQYVDLGYAVPPETVLPPFASRVARGPGGYASSSQQERQHQQ